MKKQVATGGVPVAEDPDSGVAVEQKFTRTAPTTGDEELNSEISLWRQRPSYRIARHPLWSYYNRSSELNIDDEAAEFLVASSIEYGLTGSYWIELAEYPSILETLSNIGRKASNSKTACELLFMRGDRDEYEQFIESTSLSGFGTSGKIETMQSKISNSAVNRADFLMNERKHRVAFDDTSVSIDLGTASKAEILDKIPQVASALKSAQQYVDEEGTRVHKRDKFKHTLYDMEIALLREVFSE
ncbi:hypothetical protein [Halobaculum rubrum]|uniref:hypothetical protein n=1 Tax=Halobaculum rubrum TaxID=2872158 RepID=UPI001CA44C43|nr:hypothetical protein [Halobaculum rubrum]QZX99809.1 hypothetical protein K6T25_01485 [Halobaculum rubrum]QZX99846.1 hypothetical protein K6T25_01680 [Halobaculum rubrum]